MFAIKVGFWHLSLLLLSTSTPQLMSPASSRKPPETKKLTWGEEDRGVVRIGRKKRRRAMLQNFNEQNERRKRRRRRRRKEREIDRGEGDGKEKWKEKKGNEKEKLILTLYCVVASKIHPLMGGPIMLEKPRKRVRRPKAEVRLSRPIRSTSTMDVREM